MDVEKQFLSYIQQIIKVDMPDDLKVKMIFDQAMTMARTRENLIFDQLSTQFKEAVKEQY